jgi:hypothetical protein
MSASFFPRALLTAILALAFPVASFAHWDVGISVGFAPPVLPVYIQPPCPVPGYIWTPGYWAYSDDDGDYYWVPGTWVLPPSRGLLWTPGYWAVLDNDYLWHEGYWAPHVGFYGGINYGFGYFGVGFAGGHWRGGDFYYNRAVTNVTNINVTNVYNSTVTNNHFYGGRASFNGGNGVHARPTSTELWAAREPHRGFTAPQQAHVQSARTVPGLLASVNHGHPAVAATARPGQFQNRNVQPARFSGGGHEPANMPTAPRMSNAVHANSLPVHARATQTQVQPHPAWNAQPVATRPAPYPAAAPRPATYRPAPAPAYHPASAYHPAPAYRAPPPMPRPSPPMQSHAAPPRTENSFHNAHVNAPAPAQRDHRRS